MSKITKKVKGKKRLSKEENHKRISRMFTKLQNGQINPTKAKEAKQAARARAQKKIGLDSAYLHTPFFEREWL